MVVVVLMIVTDGGDCDDNSGRGYKRPDLIRVRIMNLKFNQT